MKAYTCNGETLSLFDIALHKKVISITLSYKDENGEERSSTITDNGGIKLIIPIESKIMYASFSNKKEFKKDLLEKKLIEWKQALKIPLNLFNRPFVIAFYRRRIEAIIWE